LSGDTGDTGDIGSMGAVIADSLEVVVLTLQFI
jgi:hypothetical protein